MVEYNSEDLQLLCPVPSPPSEGVYAETGK